MGSQTALRLGGCRTDGDCLLAAIKEAPDGLTRTEIRDLFAHHKRGAAITRMLGRLASEGLVSAAVEETGGRPATRWRVDV